MILEGEVRAYLEPLFEHYGLNEREREELTWKTVERLQKAVRVSGRVSEAS